MKTLKGTYISQGNTKGVIKKCTEADSVLYTSDLVGCVAVCGFNRVNFFLIHSDSTGTGGIGATSLIDGIKALTGEIGTGTSWTITLYGGSIPGVNTYLSQNLSGATIVSGAESDSAYICANGFNARNKASLALLWHEDEVKIE